MERLKLKELSSRLREEIKKAEIAAVESKQAANEVSHGMAASYSVAGDVEHAKNSALLSLQKFSQLKKLKEEIDEALKYGPPKKVGPSCFISMSFDDGRSSELYFVKNLVYVSSLNLVSQDSLLGKAIVGKGAGANFSYKAGEQKFSGTIFNIS